MAIIKIEVYSLRYNFIIIFFLGSMFLSPTSMLGASAAAISIYGGLILFSGFLLYDTQRIVRAAEVYPQYHPQPYDPVNM